MEGLDLTVHIKPGLDIPPLRPAGARRIPSGLLSRKQIIEAADRCLRTHGYDGTTIRAIAGLLGCAVGSIYRYFPDKRQLILALAHEILTPVLIDLQESQVSLAHSIRDYLNRAAAQKELYHLWFWLHNAGRDSLSPIPDCVSLIIDHWAALIGDFNGARDLWINLHGRILLNLEDASSEAPPIPARFTRSASQPSQAPDVPATPVIRIIPEQDVTLL